MRAGATATLAEGKAGPEGIDVLRLESSGTVARGANLDGFRPEHKMTSLRAALQGIGETLQKPIAIRASFSADERLQAS